MELEEILKNVSQEERSEFCAILESFLKDNEINDLESEYLNEESQRIGIDYDLLMIYLKEEICRRAKNKETKENKAELFKLADIFISNGELSSTERKILLKKAAAYGVSETELTDYINAKTSGNVNKNYASPGNQHAFITVSPESDQIKQYSARAPRESGLSQKRGKRSKTNYGAIFPICVILVCAGFFIYNYFYGSDRYSRPVPVPLDEFIQNNPRFIFQEASLRKYLSYGTPSKTPDLFERLTSFQVKATGLFSFDLENITVNKKTDEKRGNLVLDFQSDNYFPINVDVDIKQEDIIEVDHIDPKEIPDSLAKSIGRYVAIPAAMAGGVLGAKATSSISCWLGKKAGMKANAVGALAGSAAAGITAYIFTSKFLAGLKLSSGIGVEQTEEFLIASKQLIAAELLDMNYSTGKEKKLLREKYESIIKQNLTDIALGYGWKTVEVKYHYN